MGSTLETTWKGWMVCGRPVTIAATADIPSPYRPRQARADLVKRALLSIEGWQGGEGVIHTAALEGEQFPLDVVPLDGLMPEWYKHVGHHAHHVQLSPFVPRRHPRLTSHVTVELVGTVGKARLVRAYPGDYVPPLPWMGSAKHSPGGKQRSIEFWRQHAYVRTAANTARGSGMGRRAPSWFTTTR